MVYHGAPTSGLTTGTEGVVASRGLFEHSVVYGSSRLTWLIAIDVHVWHSTLAWYYTVGLHYLRRSLI